MNLRKNLLDKRVILFLISLVLGLTAGFLSLNQTNLDREKHEEFQQVIIHDLKVIFDNQMKQLGIGNNKTVNDNFAINYTDLIKKQDHFAVGR